MYHPLQTESRDDVIHITDSVEETTSNAAVSHKFFHVAPVAANEHHGCNASMCMHKHDN